MDKETLSNYGWVIICIIVIVIMIALATPFGEYIRDAVKAATESFGAISSNYLKEVDSTYTAPTFTAPKEPTNP